MLRLRPHTLHTLHSLYALRVLRLIHTNTLNEIKTQLKTPDFNPQLLRNLQGSLIKSLGNEVHKEQIDECLVVYKDLLGKNISDANSCARLTLLLLNNGFKDQCLEPFTLLVESRMAKYNGKIENVLDKPQFLACCLSALSAFFVLYADQKNVEIASKLVPITTIPSNLKPLDQFGGIRDLNSRKLAEVGLAKLAAYKTSNFTTSDFLNQVSKAPYAEVLKRWEQIQLALSPNEISEKCYIAFIRRFADTNQTKRGFEVWQQLTTSGVKITPMSWAALLRVASKAPANSLSLFNAFWDKMISNGYKPNVECYAERIFCLVTHKQYEQAVLEFNELRQKSPELVDIHAFDLVVTHFARTKNFKMVDELLEWAKKTGLKLNSYSFNPILENASSDKTDHYFDLMLEAGVKPDIVTYTFVMNRMLKRGLEIEPLLREMEQVGIKPNLEFNTAMAFTVGKQTKNIELSRKLINIWAKNREPVSSVSLHAFVELELEMGFIERAVEYSTKYMAKFGLSPSVPMHNQIIRHSLQRKRFDVALNELKLLTEGIHPRLRANTFTFVHLLGGWTPKDYQDPTVRNVLEKSLQALAGVPEAIDVKLARRITTIRDTFAPELVPEEVSLKAEEVLQAN